MPLSLVTARRAFRKRNMLHPLKVSLSSRHLRVIVPGNSKRDIALLLSLVLPCRLVQHIRSLTQVPRIG
jgi:hypothetical protein